MNFLDSIWLIPLFPLMGAAVMLLIGKRLDPQAPSDVMIAPDMEQRADDHGHGDHGHGDHGHGGHGHGHHAAPATKILVSLLCPGMVLASFLLSLGAVLQLAGKRKKFTKWCSSPGSPGCRSKCPAARRRYSLPTGVFCLTHSAP